MGIEEVVVDTALILISAVGCTVFKLALEEFYALVGIECTCPQVDLPSHRPPRRGQTS